MSRVANNPVPIPSGVEINLSAQQLTVKGGKGSLALAVHDGVEIVKQEGVLKFSPRAEIENANALAGTLRMLVRNMVQGVSQGFEKKLTLIGVGYRAQMKGKNLLLNLGFSHPVEYTPPQGISIEAPSQTEIVVKGIDKQVVGQVAADIRSYRPPEPYKGKGVRYADEVVKRKEAKKK